MPHGQSAGGASDRLYAWARSGLRATAAEWWKFLFLFRPGERQTETCYFTTNREPNPGNRT